MCAILSKLQQNEEINEKPSLQNKSCVFIYIYLCICIMYVLNAKPEINRKLFYLFLGIGFMI